MTPEPCATTSATEARKLPRYVDLLRCSTKGQADRDTPEMQRKALDQLAERRGGVRAHPRIEALAVSGGLRLDERDDLRVLFDLLSRRAIDEVRVYAIDRLTRSDDPVERATIYQALRQAGAKIVTTTGREIDPCAEGDGAGIAELGYMIEAWGAAQEKARIHRRMTDGRRRAAASGYHPGGRASYGLTFDRKAKEWHIVEKQAGVVKQIFQLAADGASLNQIKKALADAGVTSPDGSRWASTAITKLIRNPAYTGHTEFHVGGDTFPITVPAIITPELAARAQAGLRGRKGRPSGRPAVIEALCRGLARCGTCGAPVYVASRDATRTRYYECSSRTHRRSCGNIRFYLPDVDAAVWAALRAKLQESDVLSKACETADSAANPASFDVQIATCEKKLAALERKAVGVVDLRADGLISEQKAKDELDRIRRERANTSAMMASAREARSHATEHQARLGTLAERLDQLRAALDSPDFATRRAIVQAIVPAEPDFGIILHANRRIEIRGAISTNGIGGGGGGNRPKVLPGSERSRYPLT